MGNTGKSLRVDPDKVTDLLELKAKMDQLTEKQKLFIAGAVAALSAKLDQDVS